MQQPGPSKDAWRARAHATARAVAAAPAWLAPALMLAAGGALLLYLTRGTTFWFDEWSWVAERRGWHDETFLRPHNGHLSLIPIAIYKALFEISGLERSIPYRVVLVSLHLLLVAVVWLYVARRLGRLPALFAAALLLVFGPGSQNLVWTFQITWLGSLAAGAGAFLALDRHDRAGDVAASVLLAVSLACSGLGIPIAAGLVVEVALTRRRWWIAGAPLIVYAVWWLAYQDYESQRSFLQIPAYAADAAAATMSSLAGLSGPLLQSDGTAFGWGRPLAVVAAVVLVWRLATTWPVRPRIWALLAVPLVFWLAIGLERAALAAADSSRYMTVGAVFVLLLVAELARGVRPPLPAKVAIAAALALAIVSNFGHLRSGAAEARGAGTATRVALGALEIERAATAREEQVTGIPGYPLVQITAGDYFDAVDQYGSPAATEEEIAAAPEPVRIDADSELVRLHDELTEPEPQQFSPGDDAPAIDAATGGAAAAGGRGCVVFLPDPLTAATASASLELTVPAGGLFVKAAGGAAELTLRRFAAGFGEDPHLRLAPGTGGTIALRPDGSDRPWHVKIAPVGRLSACGLRHAS